MNKLMDLFRSQNNEAIGVYEHVTAQQQIANVAVDRSIELYMAKNAVPPEDFDRLRKAFTRVAKLAAQLGLRDDKCKECPAA